MMVPHLLAKLDADGCKMFAAVLHHAYGAGYSAGHDDGSNHRPIDHTDRDKSTEESLAVWFSGKNSV